MHMYHEPSINLTRYRVTLGKEDWDAVGTQIGASPNGGNISIANTFLVLITLALVVTMILIQCMQCLQIHRTLIIMITLFVQFFFSLFNLKKSRCWLWICCLRWLNLQTILLTIKWLNSFATVYFQLNDNVG